MSEHFAELRRALGKQRWTSYAAAWDRYLGGGAADEAQRHLAAAVRVLGTAAERRMHRRSIATLLAATASSAAAPAPRVPVGIFIDGTPLREALADTVSASSEGAAHVACTAEATAVLMQGAAAHLKRTR
jgi:hypothetical protein